MLKFGLDKILQSEESSVKDLDLEEILGASAGGEWMVDERKDEEEEKEEKMEDDEGSDEEKGTMSELFFLLVELIKRQILVVL